MPHFDKPGWSKTALVPFRGAATTVDEIRRSALACQNDSRVRQLAEDICREVRSKDYLSEYQALYYYVLANTRYMRDPRTREMVKKPYLTASELLSGKVANLDCDDTTVLLAALLLSIGAQVQVVTVAFNDAFHAGERQYSHVFVRALEPRSKQWIVLDPVAGARTQEMLGRVVAAKIWNLA